jgi:hypothetical protein
MLMLYAHALLRREKREERREEKRREEKRREEKRKGSMTTFFSIKEKKTQTSKCKCATPTNLKPLLLRGSNFD